MIETAHILEAGASNSLEAKAASISVSSDCFLREETLRGASVLLFEQLLLLDNVEDVVVGCP